ncbi:hypothetical protein D9756_003629 [Leucocoprinus leucothites]|uniref:Serine aminopeptidase S33 domain-containing protein n=1 Tax=Leucocoprinus leucothites TaxID=201217 RepID=A0A8H5LJF6_9AGAR|nr:hypothetical protein D9756_003629 [Leucoagaricus leucothites]
MAVAEEPLTLSSFLKKLVYNGQPYLVYPAAYLPKPRRLRLPTNLGLPYRNIEVMTSDNIRLRCFLMEHAPPSATSVIPSAQLATSSSTPSASNSASTTPSAIPEKSNDATTTTTAANAKTTTTPKHKHTRSHSRAYSSYGGNNKKPKGTVLMFHGNGMDHSDLLYHARYYFRYGCNVLTVSYRGYGESEGVPSEKGLQRDAQAVLDFVWNDAELSKIPIIIYGLSLGGAVAIDVTSKNPEKRSLHLVKESTFLSLPSRSGLYLLSTLIYISHGHPVAWILISFWSQRTLSIPVGVPFTALSS